MEENIAILMADLSGYTALTETHGSDSAADLVEEYIEMVNDSLVADCHLHQIVGDEVIIVSSSPDYLLSTAILLMQKAHDKHNFLQLHGGLHYGKILKRNDNYFGTTINLTSRITNTAHPGTFCCSEDYVNALKNNASITFTSKGRSSFKNISEDIHLFELDILNPNKFSVDPVCRMLIHKEKKAVPHPNAPNIFFCSAGCLDIYTKKEFT